MPSLVLSHLRKRFGDLQALDDLSFSVAAGEIFGFVGSNGAGKTTTMRIALGVLAADAGTVTWDGRPLDLDLRRTVGYMPEERGLYPQMKVGEQLVYLARLHGLGKEAATAAMEEWTERLGIAERRGDEVMRLSLGNQQRVQLAAALVHDPAILVLDEPFSGLDPVAVDVMSTVLQERAAAGVPVVFSSHQLDLVERLCDRVGIVRAGRMEAVGTIDELRSTATPRWRLTTSGLAPGWEAAVPGVRVVETATAPPSSAGSAATSPGTVVLEEAGGTAPGGGPQAALAAALAAGTVLEFSPVRPSLTDLFRHVVTTPEETGPVSGAPPAPAEGREKRRRTSRRSHDSRRTREETR